MSLPNEVIVSASKLTAIGDAIRTKTGGQADLTLDEMATAVSGISTGGLPSEYEQVDYITTVMGGYIDSGFQPDSNTRVVFMGVRATSSGDCNFFGARKALKNDEFSAYKYTSDSAITSRYGTTEKLVPVNSNFTFFDKDKNVTRTTIASETDTVQTFSTGLNAYIGAWNNNGSLIQNATAHIFYVKIWDNGTLVRYYLPCYRKSDNEIGMYDTVNGQFYTNAGSGNFTCYPAPPSN